jgi:hydrogenase expression/formation protein HypD
MMALRGFRDPELASSISKRIWDKVLRPIKIMEVCGTHTMSIARFGIRDLLPPSLTLISGPGCPVCVTSQGDIEAYIGIGSASDNTVLVTFGDMMRVPARGTSLQKERAKGKDIRVVYSPMEALEMAEREPEKRFVFMGIGFETTAPAVAFSIMEAKRRGIGNYMVYSSHKLVPPALLAILSSPDLSIDGFILPGHVSTIIGSDPYGFIPEEYGRAAVIAGFEPVDILMSIEMILDQINSGDRKVEIQYKRVVRPDGNRKAREIMYEVFEVGDASWRGFGVIPRSGLFIKESYSDFDASKAFALSRTEDPPEPKGCSCGDVLRGLILPYECKLFGKACKPESPVGPCMVSSEGSCAAYYKYRVWRE